MLSRDADDERKHTTTVQEQERIDKSEPTTPQHEYECISRELGARLE